MNQISGIRELLSWTQPELAAYLGVTRSLLSMAEIGKRELPTAADQKLNRISIEYAKILKSKRSPSQARQKEQEHISRVQAEMKSDAEYSEALTKRLERKLKAMEAKYELALTCLSLLETLLSKEAKGSKTKKSLQHQFDLANSRLKEYAPARQIELQEKINQHASKATFRRTLLKKIEE